VTETGGTRLDDESEINAAVENILSVVDANKGDFIKIEDLTKHWSSIGTV
jgi:hypothetical protein